MKKILYFDTETTGIDKKLNDIIQFAAILDVDGVEVERCNIKMQPFSYENIEPKAIETHGITIEEMKTFMTPQEGYKKITTMFKHHINKYEKTDKMYPAGYNVEFDIGFLSELFAKNKDKYLGSFINWRKIDPLPVLYMLDCSGKLELENYKLATVCKFLGIEIDAHDAMSDILATKEVIKRVMSLCERGCKKN